VHLVGFIVETYYDARPYERQKSFWALVHYIIFNTALSNGPTIEETCFSWRWKQSYLSTRALL